MHRTSSPGLPNWVQTEQTMVMAEQLVEQPSNYKEKKTSLVEELGKLLKTVSYGAQGQLKPEDNHENFRKKQGKNLRKMGF